MENVNLKAITELHDVAEPIAALAAKYSLISILAAGVVLCLLTLV